MRQIDHFRGTCIIYLAQPHECCYAQSMARALAPLFLGLLAFASMNFAAASEPCKDCSAETGPTLREQIKAARALDLERMAKESASRPWDGKDIGQGKRLLPEPATIR